MTSDPLSSDFSYKKYSLEQLDNWVHDALNCEDLAPEDIYDTIVKCVDDSVEYHKKYLTKSVELLSLLKGQRSIEIDTSLDHIDASPKSGISSATQRDWTNFWEEHYYPEEVSDKEYKDWAHPESGLSKNRNREYNLREAEYYNKRAQLDADYEAIKAAGGYDWTPLPEKDKVKKWHLPVEEVENGDTMETEYFVTFPDDLLEAADLKEGDTIEWVDQNNGSYLLKKVEKKAPTYDEMIAAGYTMTDDGFWIKEIITMDEC